MATYSRFLVLASAVFLFSSMSANAQSPFGELQSFMNIGGENFSDVQSDLFNRALEDMENSLANFSLQAKPSFPAPEEKTVVSLNDYSINSTGARVEWYVDGVLVSEANNKRSVTVTAPKLGSSMTVTARFLFPSGRVSEAVHTVRPIQIDVIIEPLTRTPAFYKGRSLASQQATIRAIAMAYSDESGLPAEGFSYKWKTSSGIIEGGVLFEGNVVEYTPPLRRSATISLEVYDNNGTLVGTKMVNIPLIQPRVNFYEVNPLRGQSNIAVGNPFRISASEVTMRAEPYHTSFEALQDPAQEIRWRLGGVEVDTGADPFLITLREQGGPGRSIIDWTFRSPLKQLQSISGAFAVQY